MSRRFCRVQDCFSHKDRDPSLAFYHFPRNVARTKAWIKALHLKSASTSDVVCEKHFAEDSFAAPVESGAKRRLKCSAVPRLGNRPKTSVGSNSTIQIHLPDTDFNSTPTQ